MLIDAHTHGWPGWTDDDVRQCFAITGADRIILAANPHEHWPTDRNEGCARFLERFPERTSALVGIHPPDVDQSLRDIETYSKKGFIGVKLMPTAGYYPDDEKYRRIFEEVNARKMILLSHCGWCSRGHRPEDIAQSTRYSDPLHLEPLIRVFPDIDFIFAHGGGRTTFQDAFELVHFHENAWVDLCPGNGLWVLVHAGEWHSVVNWDRVLFGTDACYGRAEGIESSKDTAAFVRVALRNIGFEKRTDDVMGGNAERLLRRHGVQEFGKQEDR